MRNSSIVGLTALELRERIAAGTLRAPQVAGAFLEAIAAREPEVGAWAHVDPELVMRQAEALDRDRASGSALGPLHGVPVGLKDVIDTRDLPTENGTALDSGRRPLADAAVTERLREAGAIILGKTVTTELAVFTPGKTRNPHDPARTPGGSSSGSAAAVGAGMTPLAIGTQTNGSVIRPASFCGVVGFKPTRGLISRHGILPQSGPLDQVGTFSRTIEDAALLVDVLAGYDARDAGTVLAARPNILATAMAAPPLPPTFAFVPSPVWHKAEEAVQAGFSRLVGTLGERIERLDLPEPFQRAHEWHRAINYSDLALNYGRYYDRGPGGLSERLRGMIEEGQAVRAVDYNRALQGMAVLNAGLERIFERCDAILTPAAPGEAPLGEATGDPSFNTLWTYCGVPAITLPLLTGANGMPIGLQLIGRRFEDGKLLRAARWLSDAILGVASIGAA